MYDCFGNLRASNVTIFPSDNDLLDYIDDRQKELFAHWIIDGEKAVVMINGTGLQGGGCFQSRVQTTKRVPGLTKTEKRQIKDYIRKRYDCSILHAAIVAEDITNTLFKFMIKMRDHVLDYLDADRKSWNEIMDVEATTTDAFSENARRR